MGSRNASIRLRCKAVRVRPIWVWRVIGAAEAIKEKAVAMQQQTG
jgi:hypothetical protein